MKKSWLYWLLPCAWLAVSACSDDEDGEASLQNELIKRTVSPLVAGERIEFAYAAGLPGGKLQSVRAEASAAGAAGTGFEPYAWRTENGTDVSTEAARDCLTQGAVSTAAVIDAGAVTLRYGYVIPPELKGKEVSFVFSAVSQTGETAEFATPAYRVSNMEMAKGIALSGTPDGARYFSIADMKAYTRQEVESGNLAGRIDFVYGYAAKKSAGDKSYDYKHAFFSPAAEAYYPDGFAWPAGWVKNRTLMEKKLYVWDGQLKEDTNNAIYVDDVDLQRQSFANAADYVLDLKTEGSVFMQSPDGRYVAYLYINWVDDKGQQVTIGVKRLEVL